MHLKVHIDVLFFKHDGELVDWLRFYCVVQPIHNAHFSPY